MFLQPIPRSEKKFNRIISLVPSITEFLFYLNLENEVVGITKFCVHPKKWFRNKPRIGGTKNINFKIIEQLSPDLIIANKEENVKEQVEELADKYNVLLTDVTNLSDAIDMMNAIGKLTGTMTLAASLANQLKDKFENLKKIAAAKRKIRTAYFIWKDPFMVAAAGTFINEMMQYCGLENIFADQKRYPEILLQEIKEKDCALIILSSEPYPFKEKHKEEFENIFPDLKIILADGEMFSWYGSRLLKSGNYFEKFLKTNS